MKARFLILGITVMMLALSGCTRKETRESAEAGEHKSHATQEGVTFSEKNGLNVPTATAEFICLQVTDVEERKVAASVRFSARVLQAASERQLFALATAFVSPAQATLLTNGQGVVATANGTQSLKGKVADVNRSLEKVQGQAEVTVAIDDSEARLANGVTVSVSVPLGFGLRFRWIVVLPMIAVFTCSVWLFTRLGAEFIPQLDEGDLTLQFIRSSSAGLEASLDLQKKSEKILRAEFPEIREIFSKLGTAEIATDPMGANVADTFVLLHPREKWRETGGRRIAKEELAELMQRTLVEKVPGQAYLISQPIQMRFNVIMAGARADLACKIYGDSFEELERLAGELRAVLQSIAGGEESEFDAIG